MFCTKIDFSFLKEEYFILKHILGFVFGASHWNDAASSFKQQHSVNRFFFLLCSYLLFSSIVAHCSFTKNKNKSKSCKRKSCFQPVCLSPEPFEPLCEEFLKKFGCTCIKTPARLCPITFVSIQSETHKTSKEWMAIAWKKECCCTGVNIKNRRSLDSRDHHKIKKVPWPGLYFETHVLSNERLCDFCATESLGAHVVHRKTWMEINDGLTYWNRICLTLICLLIVVLLEKKKILFFFF